MPHRQGNHENGGLLSLLVTLHSATCGGRARPLPWRRYPRDYCRGRALLKPRCL